MKVEGDTVYIYENQIVFVPTAPPEEYQEQLLYILQQDFNVVVLPPDPAMDGDPLMQINWVVEVPRHPMPVFAYNVISAWTP